MSKFEWLMIVVVAALMATAGFWYSFSRATPGVPTVAVSPPPNAKDIIGQPIPVFKMVDINAKNVRSEDFLGQVVLYNFWATWCAPCREEMPMLQEFYDQYRQQGFQVVGIAIDEIDKVRSFAAELEITYPLLVGDSDAMRLNREFGNLSGALPYSVLADQAGIIHWQGWGIIQHDQLEQWAKTYL